MLEGASQLRLARNSGDIRAAAQKWIEYKYVPREKPWYWHNQSPTTLINEMLVTDLIAKPDDLKKEIYQDYYSGLSSFGHWNSMPNITKERALSIAVTFGFLCLRYTIQFSNEFFPITLDKQLEEFTQQPPE
jgi:hypothetical protein